jgi:hypothetical protein
MKTICGKPFVGTAFREWSCLIELLGTSLGNLAGKRAEPPLRALPSGTPLAGSPGGTTLAGRALRVLPLRKIPCGNHFAGTHLLKPISWYTLQGTHLGENPFAKPHEGSLLWERPCEKSLRKTHFGNRLAVTLAGRPCRIPLREPHAGNSMRELFAGTPLLETLRGPPWLTLAEPPCWTTLQDRLTGTPLREPTCGNALGVHPPGDHSRGATLFTPLRDTSGVPHWGTPLGAPPRGPP